MADIGCQFLTLSFESHNLPREFHVNSSVPWADLFLCAESHSDSSAFLLGVVAQSFDHVVCTRPLRVCLPLGLFCMYRIVCRPGSMLYLTFKSPVVTPDRQRFPTELLYVMTSSRPTRDSNTPRCLLELQHYIAYCIFSINRQPLHFFLFTW